MTATAPDLTRPARRRSVLAITAFVIVLLAVLPPIAIVLVALLPGMEAAPWLLIVVLPVTAVLGFLALVLAVIALVLDVRAGRSWGWSGTALGLGIVAVLAPLGLILGWFV